MAEPGSGRTDPFTDVISLVAGPIATVIRSFDQLRRGSEELIRGLENFNATMENLNETAGRVNRLLNDFEEPVRAMLPQITRTVRLADDLSTRLSAPLDQVVPGLNRLAALLNSPVLTSMPTDLGQFLEVINDLTRRMSPLAQIAEQAGGLFGLRIPGLSQRTPTTPAAPSTSRPSSMPRPSATSAPVEPITAMTSPAPSRRAASKRSAITQTPARKRAAGKRAPAKKAAPGKRPAAGS